MAVGGGLLSVRELQVSSSGLVQPGARRSLHDVTQYNYTAFKHQPPTISPTESEMYYKMNLERNTLTPSSSF